MEPIFFELPIDQENRQVCLVDLPKCQTDRSIERIADWLAGRYANKLEHTDLLVLRPDVSRQLKDAKRYAASLPALARKAPQAGIHVLYSFKFDHQLSGNLSASSPAGRYSTKTCDAIIEGIREREFEHYASHSDALLSARKGFVYRAPSRHYVSKFLRVGNIQKSRQALDATFFWMLPFLQGRSAIIADTWSISSIAINAARLLGKYQRGMDCKVDFLPEYFDGRPQSRQYAQTQLLDGNLSKETILMLFSAVRSGKSLQRIQEAFSEILPAQTIEYLAIYSLDGGESERVSAHALCARLKGFREVPKAGAVVRIDPSSFFPMIVKDKPLKIRKVNANGNYAFFTNYKGLHAFRIHRDVRDAAGNKLRHHAFDISVEHLLSNAEFLGQFRDKLRSLPYPSVIVVPPHKAGELMGRKAKEILKVSKGQTPVLVVHADLDPKDDRLECFRIKRQKEILILDDVSITGQRLNRFQANLRSWNFRGHVTYLVGVARPNDEMMWVDLVNNLSLGNDGKENTVECLEKVVLPNWYEKECPWCQEHDWLSEMIRSSNFSKKSKKLAVERLKLLQEAADGKGLTNNVFWIPPGKRRPTLTPGAIFLPDVDATEADITSSVAGAIQRMRVDSDDRYRLEADFPQPRVLSPYNFLGPSPRYNDLVIRMSVLRNALPRELTRWDDDDENQRADYLRNALIEDHCSFALELTGAIAQGKFPLMTDDDLTATLPPTVKEILGATLQKQ